MANFISREIAAAINEAAKYYQVLIVTGPRQVGKTTLCQHLFPANKYYNMEDTSLREYVANDLKGFISGCGNQVIIDEVQHVPRLLSHIQIAVDEIPDKRFVLTGSNNFSLLEQVTQSLAGRAALFTLLPFSLSELSSYAASADTDRLLFNGLYPGTIVKKTPPLSFYKNYYSTYVERDVRQLINLKNVDAFQLFIRLCAGRVGAEFNASALANEIGVSSPTIKQWLTLLQASYILFKLPPYYSNINKRLVKTPKIYFYDTGLLCFLLGIETPSQLRTHPLRGSIFENLAVVELLKKRFNADKTNNLCFYRENAGREVDIVQVAGQELRLYEIKSSKTYHRDFAKNLDYLKSLFGEKVTHMTVVYDGDSFPPAIVNVREL